MADDKYSRNRQKVFDLLKTEGYNDIGDSADELFKDKYNSELAYKLLTEAGYTGLAKDYNEFASKLYAPESPAQEPAVTSAAPGRITSMFGPETSSFADAPISVQKNEAQRVAQESAAAKAREEVERQEAVKAEEEAYRKGYADLADTYEKAREANAPIIEEYERRKAELYQQGSDRDYAFIQSETKWLQDNKAAYDAAKQRIAAAKAPMDEYQGLYNLEHKQERLAGLDQKIQENKQAQRAVRDRSKPGSPDYDAVSAWMEHSDEDDYTRANEILRMAKQTYRQSSKYEGYEGNWMQDIWNGAKQFVKDGVNNIDRGSFTFGISEGDALSRAREIGDKNNEIISAKLKDIGVDDRTVSGLIDGLNTKVGKLNTLVQELEAAKGEFDAMEATYKDMVARGGSPDEINSLGKELNRLAEDLNKRIEKEYNPLVAEVEQGQSRYESIMSAVDSAVDEGLKPGEKAVLDAFEEFVKAQEARDGDVSVAGAAGAGFEQTLEFMLDFVLTKGLGTAGEKAATKLLTKRLLKKMGKDALSTPVKLGFGARFATDVAVSGARTALMFPRSIGAYGEQLTQLSDELGIKDEFGRYNFKRSQGNALLNTALTQYIEYWSEGFGEYFGAAEKALFRSTTMAAPTAAIGRTLAQYRGSIGKYLDYSKFDGQFNETLEEVVGSGLNALAGWLSGDRVGDKEAMKQFFAGEQLATLSLSFLPMSAISAFTNIKAYNRMKNRYDRAVIGLDPFVKSGAISQQELDGLVSGIKEMTPVQIKDKIVELADKARGSNHGHLPANFAQNLLGYIEGSFAMNLDNETWMDQQQKMRVVDEYAAQYSAPDKARAYDNAQRVRNAEEAAIAAGVDQDTLDLDAYQIARHAENIAESDPDKAEAMMQYAEALSAWEGMRDGYDDETAGFFRNYTDMLEQKVAVNGKISMAYSPEGTPVYIISKDATVGEDGTITTPSGKDGMVQYMGMDGLTVQTARASDFSGAFSEDFDTFVMDQEADFAEKRRQEIEQAENTISPLGMSDALAERKGQTVYISGSGAYEPVVVERVRGNGSSVVISGERDALAQIAQLAGITSPGSTRLEIPVEKLYPLLAKEEDGSLSTDQPEEAPAPATPVSPTAPVAPATAPSAEPQQGGLASLVGQEVEVTLDGNRRNVFVESVSDDGRVFYSFDDENGDPQTRYMPESEFRAAMGQSQPAPAAPASAQTASGASAPVPATGEGGIPVDTATGKKVYDDPSVTAEMAYDDLYKGAEQNPKRAENADRFVVRKSDEARKALADAQKKIADADASKAEIDNWDIKDNEDLDDLERRQNEAKQKVDEQVAETQATLPELQRKADFWEDLRAVAEENIKARQEAAKRQALIQQYGVDTSQFDLTPQSLEEAVADMLSRFFKNGGRLNYADVVSRTGLGERDLLRQGLKGVLSRDGISIDDFVHNFLAGDPATAAFVSDEQDAANTVISALQGNNRAALADVIFRNRLDAAVKAKKYAENAPKEEPKPEPKPAAAPEPAPAPAPAPAPEDLPEGNPPAAPEAPAATPPSGPQGGTSAPASGTISPDAIHDLHRRIVATNGDLHDAGKSLPESFHQALSNANQTRNDEDGRAKYIPELIAEAMKHRGNAAADAILAEVKTVQPQIEAPAPGITGQNGAQGSGETGGNSGNSGRKPVTSQVPGSPAEIKNVAGARAYFEGLYGQGEKANRFTRVWELTHKAAPAPKREDGGEVSRMAMSLAERSPLSAEEAAELQQLGIQIAEDLVNEDGFVKFPQFFKNIVETFGDGIRPFVKSIYMGAKPNIAKETRQQMDSEDTVYDFDETIEINDIDNGEDNGTDVQGGGQGVPVAGPVSPEGELPETESPVPGAGRNSGGNVDSPESGDVGGGVQGGNGNDAGNGGAGSVPGTEPGNSGEGAKGNGTGKSGGSRGGSRGGESEGSAGGSSGRGGRSRAGGRRSGVSGGAEQNPESGDVGERPGSTQGRPVTPEEKAAAEEQKAYETEKEAVKNETDTDKLKSRKNSLKEKIDAIADLVDLARARLSGQFRAVVERLRELFSSNAKKSESLSQEKVPYKSVADPKGEHLLGDTVVPSGYADAMAASIKRVEEEVKKPIAQYVQEELKYKDKDAMYAALSAEQVDAVGLAIHQIKTGRIFIVGDMTGIGKGRIGASLIRWGKLNGKKVIFCTEQPNLFSATYEDLMDIGCVGEAIGKKKGQGYVPFIINNNPESNITDEDENIVVRHANDEQREALFKSGKDTLPSIPSGKRKGEQYDFVMTTYSQLQATEEEEEGESESVARKNARNTKGRQRLKWLKEYAKDAVVIMDESHKAASAGSTRGQNAMKLVENAKGVLFLSATFAKTPTAMGLYAIRSSMNDAQITRDQLIEAIAEYGIPMQEILAATLYGSGEYVRRERDFEGVKTHWMQPEEIYSEDEIKVARDLSDKTSGLFNDIIDFQRRFVAPVIARLNETLRDRNEKARQAFIAGLTDSFTEIRYASTPYSGQVSTVVSMMLFAIKAKKAADLAIEQIKRGEKPVIAIDNTLGAYVDSIEGDVDSADFGMVLNKGLAFALRYQRTTKKFVPTTLPDGSETRMSPKEVRGDRVVEKFDSIEGSLGEAAEDAIQELRDNIIAYGKETLGMDLTISPIDYIKKRLADEGFKCGEITKRSNRLVQNEDGTWRKEPIKHNKKDTISRFNGGTAKSPLPKEETLDAVILNRSGATGNSLHASKKFGDQRPRKMIVLQAARDANDEEQIRGRIDRTGQISRGEYFYIMSPIPAERKLTMMLRQKLASLNASSVGTEDVSSNAVQAEDMDNRYGDECALDFLREHEEIMLQMDEGKRPKRDKQGNLKFKDGLLYDLFISMQRMTCAEQEMIIEELTEAYKQKIEYLNQNGINDLSSTTMNLEATTIDKAIMVKGKDNESISVFAHDATIERVEVNVLRKPLRSEDVHKKIHELGGDEKRTRTDAFGEEEDVSYGDYIQQQVRDAVDAMKAEKRQKQADAIDSLKVDIRGEIPKRDEQTDEQYEAAIDADLRVASLRARQENEYSRYSSELDRQISFCQYVTHGLKLGWIYRVPLNESKGAQTMYGRFLGFKIAKSGKPKTLEAVFATKDSRAMVSLPVVKMYDMLDNMIKSTGGLFDLFGKSAVDYNDSEAERMQAYDSWWDKKVPEQTGRAVRYMITGNILQAIGQLRQQRGTIVTFTRKDADTGEITIDRGLLLAEDFDPENFIVRTQITKADVWNNAGEFSDDVTNISVHRDGDRLVVKFNKRGREKLADHPVNEDEDFKVLCEGGNLEPEANYLRAVVSEENAEAALDYLFKNYGFTQGHLLILPDSTDKPDRIVYSGKPYIEVINDLRGKYHVYSAEDAQGKIDEEIKTYRMDVNDEDVKTRIRELVQLRQAYIRRDKGNRNNEDLAWFVIAYEQQIEELERPVPGESPADAIERKRRREDALHDMEALKEELASRGFEKGHLKHFKQGKVDLDTIIQTFEEFNGDEENARIAKKVFAIMKKLNVYIFMNEKLSNETGGETAGDLLSYNWRYFNEDWIPDQSKANTILHEMIHTMTVYAIKAVRASNDHLIQRQDAANKNALVDAANQAIALYNAISSNKAFFHQTGSYEWQGYRDYGLKNEKEMLAEVGSSQEFRRDLAKVRVEVQMTQAFGKTAFSFVDVTKAAEPQGSSITALEAVTEILDRLLDNFMPDGYRKVWAGSKYGERSYKRADDVLSREAESPAEHYISAAERASTEVTLDRMSQELGIQINRVSRSAMPAGHRSDKGYYNPNTGEMTICMDNVTDERDAIATVMHETVAHHGLRKLFGDRFNDAMVRIHAALDAKGRRWVNSYMQRHGLQPGDTDAIIRGMEEYLAHLAESGDFKNSVWDDIKEILGRIIDAIFGTDGFVFTDRELNYILRASYENLKDPNWLNTVQGRAKDTLMKRALGINETDPNRPTDPDGPGTGLVYRDGDNSAREEYEFQVTREHNVMLRENQNADLPVKIGMEQIMREVGKKNLSDSEDYLTRHNLASSRAESECHEFELFHFEPLLEQVRAIRDRLTGGRANKGAREAAYKRVQDYMYAVSGLERNEFKNNEIEQAKEDALARAAEEIKEGVDKINSDSKLTDEQKAKAVEKVERSWPDVKKKIIEKYEDMKKDWSGLTSLMGRPESEWREAEDDARAMVDAFRSNVANDDMLDELWDRVRSCTDFSLDHAYKYGLISKEVYERLHGTPTQPRMWDYYLPLRGFDEETAEEVYDYASFVNPSSNSVVVKKMEGRKTKAIDPIANILNIAETEIVQGNDNWAKQALYNFVLHAGENSLLSVRDPWYVKIAGTDEWEMAEPRPNETLEHFEKRMEAARAADPNGVKKGHRGLRVDRIITNPQHKNEHTIRLKIGGMERIIWVNGNPALARAVTGLGRQQNMKILRSVSRSISNLFTTYSLDFTARNLIRDSVYAFVSLHVKEDRAYRHRFYKNWIRNFGYGAFAAPMIRFAAMWDSGKLQQKADPTEREQMFMDFMRDGGQTGYTIVSTVRDIKDQLERSMRQAGSKTRKIRVPILGHFAALVKTLNEAFELLTRFTAYQTSREMGRSGQRAASDAKEISVNFNRRGAQSGEGPWGVMAAYLGASHYFYNAGVQGFDNFLRLFKVAPVGMTATTAGIAMMGMITPMINAMLAGLAEGDGGDGDDNDDWYWNLPEWVRRNNLVLGTGKFYIAAPLPVEFRAFYGLGDIAGSAFLFNKYPDRKFGNVALDMISMASGILPFNPIEGYNGGGNLGDTVLRSVAPDAGMFLVDYATNRDYTGRPLAKENPFTKTVPKVQGAYASTPKALVELCQKIGEQTGWDIPPGVLRDLFNNYGGGFYRVAEDLAKRWYTDEEHPKRWDDIPFLSGFTGHIDEDRSKSFAQGALHDYKEISDKVVRDINLRAGTKDISVAMAYGDINELPEDVRSRVAVQRILSGKDYELGKMYREGMNKQHTGKFEYVVSKKDGSLRKKEIMKPGVDALRKTWNDLKDVWAKMPDKTEEEKAAKARAYAAVTDAWHDYYNAQGDLAEKLLEFEFGERGNRYTRAAYRFGKSIRGKAKDVKDKVE